MGYQIKRTWMVHESGSKYYQVLEFSHTDKDGKDLVASVYNYGKLVVQKFHRPITHGRVLVEQGTGQEKIQQKKNDGYTEHLDERFTEYDTSEEFFDTVRTLVGSRNAETIEIWLSSPASDDSDGVDMSSTGPGATVENTIIDRFKGKPAAWGSW